MALDLQRTQRYPIFVFNKKVSNQYKFKGIFDVLNVYKEPQRDSTNKMRSVYIFELVKRAETSNLTPLSTTNQYLNKLTKIQTELKKEQVQIVRYKRSRELVIRLKQMYNYKCQLCSPDSPEIPPIPMENGTNYVEVHHIQGFKEATDITDEGQERGEYMIDNYKNVVVLCCYHHKLLHKYKGGFMYDPVSHKFISKDGTIKIPLKHNLHL